MTPTRRQKADEHRAHGVREYSEFLKKFVSATPAKEDHANENHANGANGKYKI